MPRRPSTSRRRFRDYLRDLPRRGQAGEFDVVTPHHSAARPTSGAKNRSFWTLLKEFFSLLTGVRNYLAIALATLTVSTLLKLLPPAATKIVIDNVLSDRP